MGNIYLERKSETQSAPKKKAPLLVHSPRGKKGEIYTEAKMPTPTGKNQAK